MNGYLAGDNWYSGIKYYKNFFIANFSYDYIYELSSKFKTFKEAKEAYAEIKYKHWKELIKKCKKIPIQLKEKLLQYDFSWSWVWKDMTEEEIKSSEYLFLKEKNINFY